MKAPRPPKLATPATVLAALPPEARTIREPNGDSGLRSLSILFGVVLISSIVLASNYSALLSGRAGHEVIAATDEGAIGWTSLF